MIFGRQSNFIRSYQISYASIHYRKRSKLFGIIYDWGPQDTVLVLSNFAAAFKIVLIYETYLTLCLEISALVYNTDNIHKTR